MNIYEKMSAITSEMKTVAKNLEVNTGKGKYKAVGEADVLKAVKELEEKYKVYSYPVDRNIVNQEILITEKTYNGSTTKNSQQILRLEIIYRFINIEKPDEYIDIKSYGDGIDTGDKAPGKAMTYGDKYALMKAYKISTGDDPDQEGSPENNEKEETKNENKTKTKVEELQEKKATEAQVNVIKKRYTGENLDKLLKANGVEKVEDLSLVKASEIIKKLAEHDKKKKEEN